MPTLDSPTLRRVRIRPSDSDLIAIVRRMSGYNDWVPINDNYIYTSYPGDLIGDALAFHLAKVAGAYYRPDYAGDPPEPLPLPEDIHQCRA